MSNDAEIEPEQCRKLYILGLNCNTTEESLKAHFGQYGEIVNCVVVREDNEAHRSRGFGFVTFKRAQMVDDTQNARPHKIDGHEVESRRPRLKEKFYKGKPEVKDKTLFVGRIKGDIEQEDIKTYFEKFGTVHSVDFVSEKTTGTNKGGFAHLEFNDYDAVDKIWLNKQELTIKNHKVQVQKVKERGKKRQTNKFDRRGLSSGHSSGGRACRDDNGYDVRRSDHGNDGYSNRYGIQTAWCNSYGSDFSWGGDFNSSYYGGPISDGHYSQRSQGPYRGGNSRGGYIH